MRMPWLPERRGWVLRRVLQQTPSLPESIHAVPRSVCVLIVRCAAGVGVKCPCMCKTGGASVVVPPVGICTYTVQSGDTYNEIAAPFCLNGTDIWALNPGTTPTALQPGQVVKVPCTKPTSCPTTPALDKCYYTIKSGDTYNAISKEYCLDGADLLALNPGTTATGLQPGQRVCGGALHQAGRVQPV